MVQAEAKRVLWVGSSGGFAHLRWDLRNRARALPLGWVSECGIGIVIVLAMIGAGLELEWKEETGRRYSPDVHAVRDGVVDA